MTPEEKAKEIMAKIWSCDVSELENSDGPDVLLIAKALTQTREEAIRECLHLIEYYPNGHDRIMALLTRRKEVRNEPDI